jgi:hypothetical protein
LLRGKATRHRGADAAARAGDDHNSIVQLQSDASLGLGQNLTRCNRSAPPLIAGTSPLAAGNNCSP